MSDLLSNALFWALACIVMIVLAAIPFSITLWLGLGWGIIVSAALAVVIGWLAGQMGPAGLTVAIPGWFAIALGLIAAAIWRVSSFIMMVVA